MIHNYEIATRKTKKVIFSTSHIRGLILSTEDHSLDTSFNIDETLPYITVFIKNIKTSDIMVQYHISTKDVSYNSIQAKRLQVETDSKTGAVNTIKFYM